MDKSQGVIYVSTGERYVNMAAMSASSLRAHSPTLPIHIFTDCNIDSYDCFDSSTLISDPKTQYGAKVDFFLDSPFQKTLFLDADTRVLEDVTDLFKLLDRCDLAMAHDPGRGKHIGQYTGLVPPEKANPQKKYIDQAPASFLPVNSGVVLYKRTDSTIKFFNAWKKAFHEEGFVNDQYTLRDQLWLSDLDFWVLPPEYNCRPRANIKVLQSAGITPKILHLNDFKREAGIPPIHSLSFQKKIKHLIKYKIMPQIRNRFLGRPY